jgi:hypothetical protein
VFPKKKPQGDTYLITLRLDLLRTMGETLPNQGGAGKTSIVTNPLALKKKLMPK